MTDLLEESRVFWDRHAQRDPLWAILSDTTKRDGKWDVTRFFQTGISEIATLVVRARCPGLRAATTRLRFGFRLRRRSPHAGAGAAFRTRRGRRYLARACSELATRLNQHPQTVSYVCNQAADLSIFEDRSFDFIVSSIVLQHVRPEIVRSYIGEFFRVLAPEGIACFSCRHIPGDWRIARSNRREADAGRCLSRIAPSLPACRARSRLAGQVTLQVEVTNVSMFDWIQREYGVLSVGDHWFDAAGGQMLTRDDGRTRLPPTLRANETCRLALTISAPTSRGQYQCEIDVAHEGVLWFHDRGSEVVRLARSDRGERNGFRAGGGLARRVSTRRAQPVGAVAGRRSNPWVRQTRRQRR